MQSKIVFREMLSELKALADVQGNYLTKEDIKKFFPGDALNEEQFGLVCEYLVSQKIKVDGYEPAQKTPETAQKTVKEHAERASASNPETEKQEENSEKLKSVDTFIDKLKKYMETDGLIPGLLFRLEIFQHTIAGI